MSPKAEEFISDEEIRECLEYAQKNKHNEALIDEILNKARKMQGISHKEAIVLLDCDLEEKNQEIYRLAEQIKPDCYVRTALSVQLLYKRLRILSISCEE